MGALENVFSWSKSRDEQFRDCQRKYYYDKYASWGGWDAKAPKDARTAYVLKNLKNRWAWKGESVHHTVENVLKAMRAGRPIPLETALKDLTETMRRNYLDSKAKKNWIDPKRNIGLFEHEYAKPVDDATWRKVHAEASDCLKHFYGSAFFGELSADEKGSWLLIEDLEEFEFEGAKVYVKLDFSRLKGADVEIYDWKTGKDDGGQSASIQIGAYAIYAMRRWKIPLSNVRAYVFNLSSADSIPKLQPLTEGLLEETRKVMKQSIEAMRALLDDPAKNVPKDIASFAFTENVRICSNCNFYRMCEKYSSPAPQLTQDKR